MSDQAVVVQGDGGAMGPLLHLAIEKGVSVEALEKLVSLHDRVAARIEAKEYADAMARFQAECPPISKTSEAKVTTKSGGQYVYRYAELDEIARTVAPHLHKHGLSYSWDSEVSEDCKRIRVTCTVAHANGHRATATFQAPTGSLSGAMSPQQEVASALTFGRRQSLIQALGLTTSDRDNDGAGSAGNGQPVTPDQLDMLESLIEQCPPGTLARSLRYVGVSKLEEVPESRYAALKGNLEALIKATPK